MLLPRCWCWRGDKGHRVIMVPFFLPLLSLHNQLHQDQNNWSSVYANCMDLEQRGANTQHCCLSALTFKTPVKYQGLVVSRDGLESRHQVVWTKDLQMYHLTVCPATDGGQSPGNEPHLIIRGGRLPHPAFGPLVLWCYDVTVRLQLIGSQQTCSKDVSAFVSCLHWRWMTLLIYTAKHILFLSCCGWTSGSCQTPRRPLPTDDRFTPRRIFRIVLWAASSSEKGLQRKAATALSPSTPSLTQRSHQSPPASDPSSFLETICHSSSGADTILKRSTNLCVISSSQLIGGC